MKHLKQFFCAIVVGLLGLAVPFFSAQAATYTPQEQANMKVVADFYDALSRGEAAHDLKQKIRGIVEQYLSADYIRHSDDVRKFGQGPEGFIRRIEQEPVRPSYPQKVLALMVHGDTVVRISTRSSPGPNSSAIYIFNMLRVQDGKLAEHWQAIDGSLKMPDGSPMRP